MHRADSTSVGSIGLLQLKEMVTQLVVRESEEEGEEECEARVRTVMAGYNLDLYEVRQIYTNSETGL